MVADAVVERPSKGAGVLGPPPGLPWIVAGPALERPLLRDRELEKPNAVHVHILVLLGPRSLRISVNWAASVPPQQTGGGLEAQAIVSNPGGARVKVSLGAQCE